ncbi:MAG TPA: hypothetical protein VH559_15535 [Gemmatimonadaceae bacterium]
MRFTTRYALFSVKGSLPPAVVQEGGGQRYTLLADTLDFQADGFVARHFVYRHESIDMQPADSTYSVRVTLPYTVVGTELTIGRVMRCPANADCSGVTKATITTDEITEHESARWSGAPELRFRRLSSP